MNIDQQESTEALPRRRDIAQRLTRPVSEILGSTADAAAPEEASTESRWLSGLSRLPKSFSTDKLPALRTVASQESPLKAAPVPRILSPESTTSSTFAVLKRRDELWSVFRNLDAEYARFASKSTALKANVVRSSLLPFLRSYANHSSNRNLRPEDLDRRINILNKWWTGLLEMLHGQNNQSISGTDRPVTLDAVMGIMDRPEWRSAPSPFCPIHQLSTDDPLTNSRPASSSQESPSDFLTASVHHNVKNIFIQNLTSQMAFVVDKMSLRNASASLVAFCGKAIAFAFMFVPGLADVLIRLWQVPVDTLGRVLNENDVSKFDTIDDVMYENVSTRFPPPLHTLGFRSLATYMRQLRTSPLLPLGTTDINWRGAWLDRWTGRESDLFYVFVKHFHILSSDFLPLSSSKRDRICSPGLLIVQAQMLRMFDASLHRIASAAPQDLTSNSPTFDDLLADPDAIASTIPFAPANAIRIMAENRLIMLVRDFLSERTCDHPIARDLFARSFNDLLQASARRVSIYDHGACYTLLDFLEEALVIIVRYEQARGASGTIINSNFWQNVCKRMISSENTMTEIRLYAFLYTIWPTVVVDPERRRDLCLGLLLDEHVFQSRFNHWCPMVRAYYMRLTCWRVGRYDGESANPDDIEILETLLKRLRTTWSFFLHLYDAAQGDWRKLPVTSPSYPTPGRRLLIIRTDAVSSHHDHFQSFDAIATAPTQRARLNGWKRVSSASNFNEHEKRLDSEQSRPNSDTDTSPEEGSFGGFIRRMIGSRARSQSQEPASSTASRHEALPSADLDISMSMQSGGAYPSMKHGAATEKPASRSQSELMNRPRTESYSFKFSLEFVSSAKTPAPPLRLFPPRLPGPAHELLLARSTDPSNPSASAQSLFTPCRAVAPSDQDVAHARYCGRALAEWTIVVGECRSFFERRKTEGVPSNRRVETPLLGVEVFRRPT
ncbi:DUF1765-domain-containing protein [Dissoconium aciculare CBS 342.82]|uniref:DUF1765-domain-containing protein n=1 Tax=Dissoconium aciculare CBS 342.82 TaxID=1314786 RepID=A0A6J3MDE0_9PEZI|nr:DUF1765-domain-containing protein [Dissoconium aciculare CBS 342.82]KAF1826030.1 DUF1765-domain-containing protein [Dissoconium aciculare CBS 342.82]